MNVQSIKLITHLLAINFFHEPHADQRTRAGVGIIIADQLKTGIHPFPSFKRFEAISVVRCMPV